MAAPYSRWRSPASLSEPSPPEELDTSRGSVASAPGYGWAAARPSPSSARGSASPPLPSPDPGESGKCSSPLRLRAGASQPSLRLAQDANLGWGGRDGGETGQAKAPGQNPALPPRAFPATLFLLRLRRDRGTGSGRQDRGCPHLQGCLPPYRRVAPPTPLKSAGTYFGRDERRQTSRGEDCALSMIPGPRSDFSLK